MKTPKTVRIGSVGTLLSRSLYLVAALAFGCAFLPKTEAQTTLIAFQGFEGSAADTWSFTNTNGAASTATGSGDTPASQRILTGSSSFQVNNAASTLTLSNTSLVGYTGAYITLRLSSTSTTTGNGADGPDYVHAFVAQNGAGFATNTTAGAAADIALAGNNNARWGYDATLTATTTAGTNLSVVATANSTSTTNYSTFRINLPDTATAAALRLNILNDSANELWNIDNISLYGTPVDVPEPATVLGALLLTGAAAWSQRRHLVGLRQQAA